MGAICAVRGREPLQTGCARKRAGRRVGWGCPLEGEDALGGAGVAGPIWKC